MNIMRKINKGLAAIALGAVSTLPGCLLGAALIADHHAHVVARGNQPNIPKTKIYTSNRWDDLNSDGKWDSEESRGKSDRFYADQKFIVAVDLERDVPEFTYWLVPKGQKESVVAKCFYNTDFGFIQENASGNLSPGSYMIVVGIGDVRIAQKNIELVPRR